MFVCTHIEPSNSVNVLLCVRRKADERAKIYSCETVLLEEVNLTTSHRVWSAVAEYGVYALVFLVPLRKG